MVVHQDSTLPCQNEISLGHRALLVVAIVECLLCLIEALFAQFLLELVVKTLLSFIGA